MILGNKKSKGDSKGRNLRTEGGGNTFISIGVSSESASGGGKRGNRKLDEGGGVNSILQGSANRQRLDRKR